MLPTITAQNDQFIAAPLQSGINRIRQAHPHTIADDEAIDHRFDRVLLAFLEPKGLRSTKLNDLAINARPDETFAAQFFNDIPKLARFSFDERSQDNDFRFQRVCQDPIDNLLRGLALKGPAGGRIMRLTDGRKEHTQIVVNLSRGRDG